VNPAKERRTISWQSPAWVSVAEEGWTLVLRLGGDLDIAARPSIEPVVMAAVRSAKAVTLDLRDLSFCDSAGVAMMIAVAQKAAAQGTRLSACNARSSVRGLFEIAHLDVLD
jgi:anti-anti-sigma factor